MREVNGKKLGLSSILKFLSDVTVVKFLLNFEGFYDWLIYVNVKNLLFFIINLDIFSCDKFKRMIFHSNYVFKVGSYSLLTIMNTKLFV
jgi:hypothetical protein